MMQFRSYLLIMVLALLAWTCKKPGCLGNAGEVITQNRPVAVFGKLVLEDNIDVELIQGNENRVELVGPANIVANIETINSADSLVLRNASGCRWLREPAEKVKARVFFSDLRAFRYNGSGNVSNRDTLKFREFYLQSDKGAGTIELTVQNNYTSTIMFIENANLILHGSSDDCYTFTNPRAQTDMRDFRVKRMYITYSGLTDTYIHVSDELSVELRYRGNIYYYGSPVIKQAQFFSSGRLIRLP